MEGGIVLPICSMQPRLVLLFQTGSSLVPRAESKAQQEVVARLHDNVLLKVCSVLFPGPPPRSHFTLANCGPGIIFLCVTYSTNESLGTRLLRCCMYHVPVVLE